MQLPPLHSRETEALPTQTQAAQHTSLLAAIPVPATSPAVTEDEGIPARCLGLQRSSAGVVLGLSGGRDSGTSVALPGLRDMPGEPRISQKARSSLWRSWWALSLPDPSGALRMSMLGPAACSSRLWPHCPHAGRPGPGGAMCGHPGGGLGSAPEAEASLHRGWL